MLDIYDYIYETNHVARVHSVVYVLYSQSVLNVMLLRRLNMFCAFIFVLSEVCVQCPVWLFCRFLI
jgi:hypothetical protein